MADFVVLPGDCVEVMRSLLEADSIDAIVCDPPYGLEFMGKDWDKIEQEWHHAWAVEALRVAKPGAHLLAFGGTRTFHRLACAIEDAGWELRDTIMWVYGSAIPHGLDVSRAIDEAAGYKRKVGTKRVLHALTDDARRWEGWHTTLKPAYEPIIVARKPLVGTVAANVLTYGTGAMNIDGCRVPTDDAVTNHSRSAEAAKTKGKYGDSTEQETYQTHGQTLGRWPANLIHDGSDEVVELFPEAPSGGYPAAGGQRSYVATYGKPNLRGEQRFTQSAGSAARFFYCAKASKADREEGNNHPTVKPTDLMRYLCRLVTQPGGLILDPFCGSGSTGKAALLEGFDFIGIEREDAYREIAEARLTRAKGEE